MTELFIAGIDGLYSLLYDTAIDIVDHSQGNEADIINRTVVGNDLEELLVETLNEILYIVQYQSNIPLVIKSIVVDDDELSCYLQMAVSRTHSRVKRIREIKAVTYYDLKVRKTDKWSTRIVLDV